MANQNAFNLFKFLLAHPLTRGLSVDDAGTTTLRRQIVRQKKFLKQIYHEWYRRIIEHVPAEGSVLEIGSGAGFFSEILPRAITSEIFPTSGVDLIADGRHLPFVDGDLTAITMTDVLHHMVEVESFFAEAGRCVRSGGTMVMIEPWRTTWSEWVYRNLHPEPFEPDFSWDISDTGILSSANGALPWIIFERDRQRFEREFPEWEIKLIEPMMPVAYLLSGGISLRALAPSPSYKIVRWLERVFGERRFAMFALIVLTRR